MQCWCGDAFDGTRIGQFACNVPCEGNGSQMCGGNQRLAVYKKGSVAPPKPSAPTPASTKSIKPTAADRAFAAPLDGWYSVGCFKVRLRNQCCSC